MRKETQTVLELIHRTADDPQELCVILGELRTLEATGFSLLARFEAKQPDELLDVKEAAKRLHVSTTYLYRHHEKFHPHREGRKLLFSREALDKYAKRSR